MGLMVSLKNMMLGADYDEDEFLEDEELEYEEELKHQVKEKSDYTSKYKNNVLNLPNSNIKDNYNNVMISHPKNISDASSLCTKFKENFICIVDLEGVEQTNAQRIADVLSGAVFVLNGNIERVTNNVFIMAPKNCSISSELKEQMKSSGNSSIFPWLASSK